MPFWNDNLKITVLNSLTKWAKKSLNLWINVPFFYKKPLVRISTLISDRQWIKESQCWENIDNLRNNFYISTFPLLGSAERRGVNTRWRALNIHVAFSFNILQLRCLHQLGNTILQDSIVAPRGRRDRGCTRGMSLSGSERRWKLPKKDTQNLRILVGYNFRLKNYVNISFDCFRAGVATFPCPNNLTYILL